MTIKQQGGIFGRNPTFNDVEANTLGVNTTASYPLDVNSGNDDTVARFLSTDTGASLRIEDSSGYSLVEYLNGKLNIYADQGDTGSNTRIRFYIDAAEVGRWDENANLKIMNGDLILGTSGNGIDFSATSGTGTSELFDDYEEGLHTVTVTPSTSGSVTLNNTQVRYTKIGNTVFISGNIRCTSVSSPVGTSIQFSLPFAIADGAFTSERIGSAIVYYDGSSDSLAFVTADTGTTSYVKQTIDASTIAAGDQWRFNFFYVTS